MTIYKAVRNFLTVFVVLAVAAGALCIGGGVYYGVQSAASSQVLSKLGSTGAKVTRVQKKLKELGYYSGAADGIYGNATKAAVKAFQKNCGITADGVAYHLGYKDCLYITQGTKEVTFASADPEHPAKFYMVSAPAHCAYQTRLIKMADANHRPLGSVDTCNKRTINQFIHPDVLKTCQLSMGMTELAPGSNWNTMPSHTHERRMEIYTYFELPEGQVVFHMCGEPTQTRHIVMHNEDAVISPSWSIHSGVGTSNYTFIWAMGGENMEFDDMDNIATTDLR